MNTTTTTKIEACARAAHEANRAYCIAIGDTSQPSWDDAPDWQKSSARNGVIGALKGATPEQSHDGWSAEKLANGWKFGPVKDPEKLEHPCLVPYAELPIEQRAKDTLFTTVVRAVGASLDAASAKPSTAPATAEHIEQFFTYAHLPPAMQAVSKPFSELAAHIIANAPRNPERTVALRKLLESKDAAVRAAIAK